MSLKTEMALSLLIEAINPVLDKNGQFKIADSDLFNEISAAKQIALVAMTENTSRAPVEPKIVTEWDSLPPVVSYGGELFSTRVLEHKDRQRIRKIDLIKSFLQDENLTANEALDLIKSEILKD